MQTLVPSTNRRMDLIALWGGIAFSVAFTALIWALGGRLDSVRLLPDQGAAWYYWKLPNPTFWSHATAWSFYLLHQVAIWTLIAWAQRSKAKYSTGLHRFNVLALGANAFFIALHLLQTHIWYDGLAQDTPIWTSQGSVIVMLVVILLMENQRRGLFAGKKLGFLKETARFWREYHGYVFAWAIIYTFWFHPTVATPGHLIGFVYMFLLMLQGSLFYTRVHTNRWWNVAQEVMVLFHGTLVAVMQGNGLWPMFAFGFAGIFVITQMWGVKLPAWVRWAILGMFVASVLGVYSQVGWGRLNEVIRIPLIEYLAVFVLAGLTAGGLWIARKVGGRGEPLQSVRVGGEAK
jgi:hypothetical protein